MRASIPFLAACLLWAPSSAAGAVRFVIDPAASQAGFVLDTTWHDVQGVTHEVTGSLTSESGDIFADGRVRVEIPVASLGTGIGMRDRKMREECLDIARHPRITFASTEPPAIVTSSADASGERREASLTARGNLTIRGVTRAVVLSATARRDGDAWQVEGALTLKLSDYEIPDPSILLNRVKDQVSVTFRATLRGQGAPGRD